MRAMPGIDRPRLVGCALLVALTSVTGAPRASAQPADVVTIRVDSYDAETARFIYRVSTTNVGDTVLKHVLIPDSSPTAVSSKGTS